MALPSSVTICDVSPRDGLQNLPHPVNTDTKVRLVERLVDAGIRRLEVTSFVRPEAVPQMADAEQVLGRLTRRAGVQYRGLAANRKGVERAIAANVDEVCIAVMASETFQRANAATPTTAALEQFAEVIPVAHRAGLVVQGAVGTAFGCPYEGEVPLARVRNLVGALIGIGVDSINLADTTGMADPVQVGEVSASITRQWPQLPISLHFHNTRGLGLVNVFAGLQAGVTTFDASLGGIGGCPFAPQPAGNVCTEDLVHMLEALGMHTGADLQALIATSRWLEHEIGVELPGQVMKAGSRWQHYPVAESTAVAKSTDGDADKPVRRE